VRIDGANGLYPQPWGCLHIAHLSGKMTRHCAFIHQDDDPAIFERSNREGTINVQKRRNVSS
jgi:hypothetical protein